MADPDDCVHAPGWPRRAASAPLRHVAGRTRSRRHRCHTDPAAAPSGASLMGSSQPMTSPLPAASQGRFIGSSHLVAHLVGCWIGLYACIRCTLASFAWMRASGGCVSSPGSMPPFAVSRSSPGTGTRQKYRSCLPPTWTKEELGKRSALERFFGRVFLCLHLQRPPLCGWSAIARQVALTYTASLSIALAAKPAGRPDLIRSPKRVFAHTWQGF